MSTFQQLLIGGFPQGGLKTDVRPMMLPNEAMSLMENAYCWRDRIIKRIGTDAVGQLSRQFTDESIGNSTAVTWNFNLFATVTPAITETYAQLKPGTVTIKIGVKVFTDNGAGLLTSDVNNHGTINYATSDISITTNVAGGTASTASFLYFPNLPVMGICKQDIDTVGIDETLYFDTKYTYKYATNDFYDYTPTETWSGTDRNFFWSCNYQGATPDLKYFFVTNNNIDLSAPSFDYIKYYDNTAWHNLDPLVNQTTRLWQALIVVPYYGRLLALNTWEGPQGATYASAKNYYARCRFSQIGDPTIIGSVGPYVAGSWADDVYGKGGFLDAPTNESIVGAYFFRNTLIVTFEYSIWQLRYIGEYGLPFIWERISSDFGSLSTFSGIIFDEGVKVVSDRGVLNTSASGLTRLDENNPDIIFNFEIDDKGMSFVHGVRDYQKEVCYWNYVNTDIKSNTQNYPNSVLLYNYRNQTWSIYRDTITCFGKAQFRFEINWDSLTTYWDSDVSWDDTGDETYYDYVVSGNQQGFISIYEDVKAETNIASDLMFAESLSIYAINTGVSPAKFTIGNHNLIESEFIYVTNTLWSGADPEINEKIYKVKIVDANTITLLYWTGNNYVDLSFSGSYIGAGKAALLPKMNFQTKDFNPYQSMGKQFKVSYVDFLMDTNSSSPSIPAVTVQTFVNANTQQQANELEGNFELVNSAYQCGYIQFADKTDPCVITSINHSLRTGQKIYIGDVLGMTQLNQETSYTITVIDRNRFSLDGVDATAFTDYINFGIWTTQSENGTTYQASSKYAWYRFYCNQYGQYLRIGITYDDSLMNLKSTHQTSMELHAMNFYFTQGGRLTN